MLLQISQGAAAPQHVDYWAAASAVAAVVAAIVAIKEARSRAQEAQRYSRALEAVIDAGQYVVHLRGLEERMASLNKQFESVGYLIERLGSTVNGVANELQKVAQSTQQVVELASRHIVQSVQNLDAATEAVRDISRSLIEIAKSARQSQRDSLRARKELRDGLGSETSYEGRDAKSGPEPAEKD
jgi:methyl-accepting chemotaxis protein